MRIEHSSQGFALAASTDDWMPFVISEEEADAQHKMLQYYRHPRGYTPNPSNIPLYDALLNTRLRAKALTGFNEYRVAWNLIESKGFEYAYNMSCIAQFILHGVDDYRGSYNSAIRVDRLRQEAKRKRLRQEAKRKRLRQEGLESTHD